MGTWSRTGFSRALVAPRYRVYKIPAAITPQYINNGSVAGAVTATGGVGPVFTSNLAVENNLSGAPNTYNILGGLSFCMDDILAGTGSFTIFQQYRIKGVRLIFRNMRNVSETDGGAPIPMLHTVADYDDSVVPSSITQICSREGVQSNVLSDKPVSIFLRPKPVRQLYDGALPSYEVAGSSPWIRVTAGSDTPHYGLKFAIEGAYLPANSASNTNISVTGTYWVEFRGSV